MKGITFTLILAGFVAIGIFQMKFLENFSATHTNQSDVYIAKLSSNPDNTCERPDSYPVCSIEQLVNDSMFVAAVDLAATDSLLMFEKSNLPAEGETTYELLFADKQAKENKNSRRRKSTKTKKYKPVELKVPEGELYMVESIDTTSVDEIRNAMIVFAKQFMGVRYKWGGRTTDGFDCSGFTSYIFKHVTGIKIPRTSFYQSKVGIKIPKEEARAGDLVFFGYKRGSSYRTKHVGLIISSKNGKLKVIHSARGGVRIDEDILDIKYYKRRYLFVKRLI